MTRLTEFCPRPPDYRLDWDAMTAEYEWVRALRSCEQSPEWHAEGNVWIHTKMVLDSLLADANWRALDETDREIVFCAAALHDIAKPATSKMVDGRITARGHSRVGAHLARELLWREDLDLEQRETVCHLIQHHQVPFFLVERADAEALALRISWTARCDLLALVARADARGRICADQQRLLDNIDLFLEMCGEYGCLDTPRPFASPSHRVAYFRDPSRHADAPVKPGHRCEVTVLSGMPAAGKDTWIGRNRGGLPSISLDAIRADLGIGHGGHQGIVVETARSRAREHLRAGEDFVWNATNISLDTRQPLLRLLLDYDAKVHIVYLETTPEEIHQRNRARVDPVPERAMTRMLRRWLVPDLTEAHAVTRVT